MFGKKKIRYAVVGLGYISQIAILPAFANARRNSELVALVSDDPEKLDKLGRKYNARFAYTTNFQFGIYDASSGG